MLFTKSASLAIAVASCSFFSGVRANNRYLFDDYSDLAASEPSTKYCLGRDIVEFGESSQEENNKRSLDESSDLALRDTLGEDVEALKRFDASAGAELVGKILGLLSGVGIGGGVHIGKRFDASIGGELVGKLLSLIGVGVGAGAGVHIGKRQLDPSAGAEAISSILGLIDGAEGSASKRQLDANAGAEAIASILQLIKGADADASKRFDASAGAELVGKILGLLSGVGIGGGVHIGKRFDASIGGELVGKLLSLIGVGIGAGAGVHIGKRQLDPSAGAEAISRILGLIDGAEGSASKRQLDANSAAEAIASILGLTKGGVVEASKREIDAALLGARDEADIEGAVSKRYTETDFDREFTLFEVVRQSYARTSQKILNKVTGSVPKASFIVSDVAWAEDDIFKVTINFETIESSQLFAKFQDELKSVKIQGTRDSSDVMLWDGSSDSKVDSFAKWSSTVLVRASKHNDLYCLPDNFAIKFDWNAKDTSDLHKQWSQYFDTTYEYSLSQQFDQQRFSRLTVAKRCFDSSNSTAVEDGTFDMNALEDWKTSSSVLPNFCWPKDCSV